MEDFSNEFKIMRTAQVQAVMSHFKAERDKAMSEIEIYLNRPVGVGDHASITEEIISLMKKVKESQEMIEFSEKIVVEPPKQQPPVQ